jgi:hypothetical protein
VEGLRTCVQNAWSGCEGEVGPSAEVCDGQDNDCDGAQDEDVQCTCIEGTTKQCGTDVGLCEFGTQSCVGNQWSDCSGGVEPVAEVQGDGADNNCNGLVDEVGGLEASCTNSVKDGDEEGADCGGSCPLRCQPLPLGQALTGFGVLLIGIVIVFYLKKPAA